MAVKNLALDHTHYYMHKLAQEAVVDAARKVHKKLSSYRNPVCVMELKKVVEYLEELEK